MLKSPSPSYSIIIRVEIENRVGMFGQVATTIGLAGGDIGAVDIVRADRKKIIREITVNARDEPHEREIVQAIKNIHGATVLRVLDRTFRLHQGGKIEVLPKIHIADRESLSQVYTPGVARVCREIAAHPASALRLSIKGNSVAIVSDGTAVLGLGNIGPLAALPVMEGKSMIFKEFAGIDAFPIVLGTTVPAEIIAAVMHISPTFGGINLEDISAPRCFEIESALIEALDIPVIHDDQHGTAVVVLAALINIARLYKKQIGKFKVVILGAGAAGTATARLLGAYGVKDIIVCDRQGAIRKGRRGMEPYKRSLAAVTNPRGVGGPLREALKGADILIGLSGPNLVSPDDLRVMAKDRAVFALANPDPEIGPEDALPLVRVLATGRSDYPNQINNMLAFPGIFRGLLDAHATRADMKVKLAAAEAIAAMVSKDELHEDYIVPGIFEKKVVQAVAGAVEAAAGGSHSGIRKSGRKGGRKG